MNMRICEKEGCDTKFKPKNEHHRFCCPRHAKNTQDRRYRKGKNKAHLYIRECELKGCKEQFETKQPQKIYCTPNHAKKARRLRINHLIELGRKAELE